MKKVEVIFSMRDWRQGSILLVDISIEDNLVLSETHEFWLDEDDIEFLTQELESSDLEFSIEIEE